MTFLIVGGTLAASLGAISFYSWVEHKRRTAFWIALEHDADVEPVQATPNMLGARMRGALPAATIVARHDRERSWIAMCKPLRVATRTTMRLERRGDLLKSAVLQRNAIVTGDAETDAALYVRGGDPDVVRALLAVPSLRHAIRVLFSVRYRATSVELDADATLIVDMPRDARLDPGEAKMKLLQVHELARLLEAHADVAALPAPTARGDAVGPSSGTPFVVPR